MESPVRIRLGTRREGGTGCGVKGFSGTKSVYPETPGSLHSPRKGGVPKTSTTRESRKSEVALAERTRRGGVR